MTPATAATGDHGRGRDRARDARPTAGRTGASGSSRSCRTKRRSAASRACCATTASGSRRCIPGFALELFRDEAEGYYLNLSSRRAGVVRALAHRRRAIRRAPWPETVSLSYNEAGRWLDAQERVDNVPLAPSCARGCRPTSTTLPARAEEAAPAAVVRRAGRAASERGGRAGFLARWSRRKARSARPGGRGRRGAGAGVAVPAQRLRRAAARGGRSAPSAAAAARPPPSGAAAPTRCRRWTTSRP